MGWEDRDRMVYDIIDEKFKTETDKEMSKRSPIRHLCAKIILQAIEDYRTLKERGVNQIVTKEDAYSIDEIEEFFRGDFCNDVIIDNILQVKTSGSEILRYLKKQ